MNCQQRILFLFFLSFFFETGYAGKVLTGLEVLQKDGFSALKGKKVGLITNPTGVDRNLNSTIDLFFNSKSL